MSAMPLDGTDTANTGTVSAEDVSGDAATSDHVENEVIIQGRSGPPWTYSTGVNVNIRTPPASPPNEPAETPHESKRRNGRMIISAVMTILILAACFAGIFYGIGAKQCACQDLTGWFCGAVMAVVGWWVPSPADKK